MRSARASRAACGASPQSGTWDLKHFEVFADAGPVNEAPTGTREGACAPHEVWVSGLDLALEFGHFGAGHCGRFGMG